MAETSQGKRARDSGDVSHIPKKKPKFNTSAENFTSMVRADWYVDKSLLIHKLFYHKGASGDPDEEELKILITAPRRFGKSVNMDMIKCFLEMHDEEIGKDLRVEESKNYNLFNGLNILKPEHTNFVKEHFAKYPVLKVNYLCGDVITKFDDMVDFCKGVIHETFLQYEYLQTSPRLSEDQKEFCEEWCSDRNYHNSSHKQTQEGLKVLSRYLCSHFDKPQVFVLIDEYDSPFMKAMFNVEMNSVQLSQIREFYSGFLGSVLKGNNFVCGAVVTGISFIAGMGISGPFGPLTHYRFLDQKHFNGFYGFTSEEVTNLFKKFNLTEHHENIARETYNGYCTRNDKAVLYNPCSIIRYISDDDKEPKSYWVDTGYVSCLKQAFQFEAYRNDLMKLVGNQTVTVNVKHKIEEKDIEVLAALSSEDKKIFDIDVFLTFLLDQGYLSYVKQGIQERSALKIPNEEIKAELIMKLRDYFIQKYNIDNRKIGDCSDSFQELFSSIGKNEKEFQTVMQNIKNNIEVLLSDEKLADIGKPNHATLQQILFIPLAQISFYYRSEVFSSVKTRADAFLFKNQCGVIIEFKCVQYKNDSRITHIKALKQIFNCKYDTLLNDKLYFPEGAEEYILMGLSINAENKDVSMCCLRKQKYGNIPTIEDIEDAISV